MPQPNYRSLVAGGFFSNKPNELRVPRAIRTNNPGALNISAWQSTFPGYVGVTPADAAGNVTTIYVTPENGVGAWHYLLTHRYGYGENGRMMVGQLARRYAGVDSDSSPAVTSYVAGWRRWSNNRLSRNSTIRLSNDEDVLVLARAMYSHEAGRPTPLLDDQVVHGVRLKRSGQLPRQ
jgi:hypothetical protein